MVSGELEALANAVAVAAASLAPPVDFSVSTLDVGGGGQAAVPAHLQLLLPATGWDWPTDANGTSSASLYDFCSWMPASADTSLPFEASTTRFSDGYEMFLNCLEPDQLTLQALARFADRTQYTTVLYAQGQQPAMPAWNVSEFPQAWIAAVGAGSSTAGTIHVPLPSLGEPADSPPNSTCFGITASDGTDTPIPLVGGDVQYMDIHADAWGMITIRPAGWYDGALVAMKASGPYHTSGAQSFFGAGGALRNLLTGMLVALRPTIVASVTPSLAATLQGSLTPDTALRIGGLSFDQLHVTAPAQPGSQVTLTATSTTTSGDAVIIGATVAPLSTATG